MNNVKAVDDLIKEKRLTLEELEFFKDLIEETKDREEKIAQCSQQTRQTLKSLSDAIMIILEQTVILREAIARILDEMETNYLRSLPVDRFYRE